MNTNLIPSKTHAFIDYVAAASLIGVPLLLSGKKKGLETYLPMALGAGVLAQSLFTKYELGVKKKISMPRHLQMDYVQGALLAAAPFLFGFRKKSWIPHVAMGVSELAVAFFSKPYPRTL
ncbi:SPW repeat domain-containing protein [Cesiribacter andamanensis]|uniref:SPW repeat-containing integral membrane domain-containing protein n=1 Tax=Cesiribacter andamanensis AMV16 TaxID=1279009 RepID=M7N0E5_9BACT|nr:hypothetical protein [Cesiribacter andamanensis]EMR02168.1 hypothetical protein ADICEAN_02682 [Cesiribacter andamanensis AMV16]